MRENPVSAPCSMMDEQFREISSAIVLARVTRFRERLGALARE